jgi:hypothetical protein
MEQTIKINEFKTEQKPGIIQAAAESLLANLPIIVFGLIIILAMAREFVI